MLFNVLNKLFFIAIIFLSTFSSAFADQEEICFSSIESYWQSVFGENYAKDDNLILKKIDGDKQNFYVFAIDKTPSRNPLGNILRKKDDNRVCIIATEIWADGVQFKFSQNGSLTEIKTWNFVYNPYIYPTIVILLKPDNKGNFSFRECQMSFLLSGKSKSYPCHAEPDMDYLYEKPDLELFSPSFDCEKANLKVEKLICKSAKLAVLDLALTFNYKNLAPDIGDKREQLTADQHAWLKQRNACKNEQCLNESYRDRLDELCRKYLATSGQVFECISSGELPF